MSRYFYPLPKYRDMCEYIITDQYYNNDVMQDQAIHDYADYQHWIRLCNAIEMDVSTIEKLPDAANLIEERLFWQLKSLYEGEFIASSYSDYRDSLGHPIDYECCSQVIRNCCMSEALGSAFARLVVKSADIDTILRHQLLKLC